MPSHQATEQGNTGQTQNAGQPLHDVTEMPPRRRALRERAWLPAALIMLVVGAIAATVLLANGGRNIEQLKLAAGRTWVADLGVALGFAERAPRRALTQNSAGAGSTGPGSSGGDLKKTTNTPPDGTSGSRLPLATAGHPDPAPLPPVRHEQAGLSGETPLQTCRKLGGARQEMPAFTSGNDGAWQCALLLTYETRPHAKGTEAASLFVQMSGGQASGGQISGRGNMPFSTFRIKFNPGRDGLTATLADEAVRLLSVALSGGRPQSGGAELVARLQSKSDFEITIDGYRAVFKREKSDPRRGNLILRNLPGGAVATEEAAPASQAAPAAVSGSSAEPFSGPAVIHGGQADSASAQQAAGVMMPAMLASGADLLSDTEGKASGAFTRAGKSSRLGTAFYDHP